MSLRLEGFFTDIANINTAVFQPEQTTWGKILSTVQKVGTGVAQAAGAGLQSYNKTVSQNPYAVTPYQTQQGGSLGFGSINWDQVYYGLPLKHWLMIGGGLLVVSMVSGGRRRR